MQCIIHEHMALRVTIQRSFHFFIHGVSMHILLQSCLFDRCRYEIMWRLYSRQRVHQTQSKVKCKMMQWILIIMQQEKWSFSNPLQSLFQSNAELKVFVMKIGKIMKISFHSYRESRSNYHGKIFANYTRFEIEAEGNAQMAVKIQIQ